MKPNITMQWIRRGEGTWESVEGRFCIYPHKEGFYIRDRMGMKHPGPFDAPEQLYEWQATIFITEDECKMWAHHRLIFYWTHHRTSD